VSRVGFSNSSSWIVPLTAPIPTDSEEMGQRLKTHTKRDVSTPLKSTENGLVDQYVIPIVPF
jgi:DNA-directed RNA polymerase II subunit RPB2